MEFSMEYSIGSSPARFVSQGTIQYANLCKLNPEQKNISRLCLQKTYRQRNECNSCRKAIFVKRIYHNTLANILVEGCIEILVENILPEEIITTTVRKLTGRVLCHNPNSKI
jgi:hypothetical protein